MSSGGRLRRLPPVCALVAVRRALVGRLGLESRYVGREVRMDDGRRFRVFRHLAARRSAAAGSPAVLVVRFRFARLPERLNRWLSLIPVPLIGGYPGFRHKLWMADEESGDWQGVYEWESAEAVEAYRHSSALRLMIRRAVPGSVSCEVLEGTRLAELLARGAESALVARTGAGGEAGGRAPHRRRPGVDAEKAAHRRSPGGAR